MRCQQFHPTRDTSLISALFDISTAAVSSKRCTEDRNAPFVRRALCPFDCVPNRLREETKSDRDINGSMWLTIYIQGPQLADSIQAWCAGVLVHVLHGAFLPHISGHFWLNLSLPTSPWQPRLPLSYLTLTLLWHHPLWALWHHW